MADDRRQQRIEEGRVQKGGNNGIPFNPPPQNLRPSAPPPSTSSPSSGSSTGIGNMDSTPSSTTSNPSGNNS